MPLRKATRLMSFGHALQGDQDEADRQHQLDRPAQQAAGVRGVLVDVVGLHEERPAQPGQDGAGRHQEDQGAQDVDPELAAAAQRHVEQVDPDMLVALQRVGGAEHHDHGEHVPLHFEPGVGARVVGIADHGVAAADDAGQQHQPVADDTDLLVHASTSALNFSSRPNPLSPSRVVVVACPVSPRRPYAVIARCVAKSR